MDWRRLPLAIGLAMLAVGGGALTCGRLSGSDPSGLDAMAGRGLGFEVFLGVLAFAGAALSAQSAWERLGLRRGRLSAGRTALLIAGTLGASLALDGALDLTGLKEHSSLGEFSRRIAGIRGPTLLLATLAFGIAPGVSEELLCRGLIQRGFVRRFGAPVGISLASAIFGALHLEPIHAASAALLGLYLGIVSHLAGGVRASIACHTVNNLVALGTGAFLPGLDAGGLPAVGAGSAAALGALWLVWRGAGPPPPLFEESGGGASGPAVDGAAPDSPPGGVA
jgi:membrane protease YdiL (CAAX protease family)